jgi:hypothetical protein
MVAAVAPCSAAAADAGPEPLSLGRIDGLTDIVSVGGTVVMKAEAGDYQLLRIPEGPPALAPLPVPKREAVAEPFDIIPHARITRGRHDIAGAWFASPTDRYGHRVLGDAVEAAALKVETKGGKTLSYRLPADSVFEDLTPRLVDIDGDGRDEIIAVRSYIDRGSAVALFGIRDGRLAKLAESEAIGRAHRWLNPVGAGDLDGDGKAEIAVVQTPHLGGILTLYRWQGDELTEIARLPGFSNHAIGSTVLGMSALADFDGDGRPEILLPDQGRNNLQAVGYSRGALRILWSAANTGPISTSIVTADIDRHGGPDIIYGLADGSVMLLAR